MSDSNFRSPDLFDSVGISLQRPAQHQDTLLRQARLLSDDADSASAGTNKKKYDNRKLGAKNLRKVVQVVEDVRSVAPYDAGELGFYSQILVQTSLPHKNPGDDLPAWSRVNRNFTLTINNTSYFDPVRKEHVKYGLPYGTLARLIFAWMGTEAVRTRNPKLELGDTFGNFLQKLDIQRTGGARGTYQAVQNQLTRLIHSPISWSFNPPQDRDGSWKPRPAADQGQNIFPIESRNLLWDPARPDERGLWTSEITLNQIFYNHLLRHNVPVDMRVIRELARLHSSLGIDIYTWVTFRVHELEAPTRAIPWRALAAQMGSSHKDMSEFARDFKRNWQKVHALYPQANLEFVQGGLRLHPSRTHVLSLPATTKKD
ncbi:replication protein RepA [Corallococcus terminator]|uniref:Pirin n=1 Tax=Corallococcus terminator TaxID=2316733 RepID=A0A3A8I0A7_9BACT|nr:replication protein RepA [Corallococcus terminator]RKG71033.1 hypothetical protein D7V88_39405 [Corallococcus terminator]